MGIGYIKPLFVAAVTLAAASALSPYAGAQEKAYASATAIIEAGGPKAGDNGKRYLNVEGKDKGKYACYGFTQFDGAKLKADLDKRLGPGKYTIKGVSLQLSKSTASFSASGKVDVYYTAEKADAAALKYPLDLKGSLKPALLGSIAFAVSEKPQGFGAAKAGDDVDRLDLMKAGHGAAVAAAISAGKPITILLAEGDSKVAATWAGKENNKAAGPMLLITAVKK